MAKILLIGASGIDGAKGRAIIALRKTHDVDYMHVETSAHAAECCARVGTDKPDVVIVNNLKYLMLEKELPTTRDVPDPIAFLRDLKASGVENVVVYDSVNPELERRIKQEITGEVPYWYVTDVSAAQLCDRVAHTLEAHTVGGLGGGGLGSGHR